MWRRIISTGIIALLAIANFNEQIGSVFGLQKALRNASAAVNTLTGLEIWLYNHWIDPFLLAAAMVVLYTGIILPDVWPHIRKRFDTTTEFNKKFLDHDWIEPRRHFRLCINAAFKKYCTVKKIPHDAYALIRLVDGVKFPDSFPLAAGTVISEYVSSAAWLKEDNKILYDFLLELYDRALFEQDDESRNLTRGLDHTAKFWDDCARDVMDGRLKTSAIGPQLGNNIRDIKLLMLSELVISQILPWDVGRGKIWLSHLAKDGATLKKARVQ